MTDAFYDDLAGEPDDDPFALVDLPTTPALTVVPDTPPVVADSTDVAAVAPSVSEQQRLEVARRNVRALSATIQKALRDDSATPKELFDMHEQFGQLLLTLTPGGLKPIVAVSNLSELWDAADNLPTPTVGARADGTPVLYEGKINWMAGEPGSGKTWLAMQWVLEAVRAGGRPVFVDMESDPVTFVARLRALGAERHELGAIRYLKVEWHLGGLAGSAMALMETLGDAADGELCVFDGLATALAQLGLDENSNGDVTAFTAAVLRPVATLGPAVLVIDHMSKPQPGQVAARYARGASAKLADVSGVALIVTVETPYSKTQSGSVKVVCAKDRNGTFAVGELVAMGLFAPGGDGTLSIQVNGPDPQRSASRFIPDGIMQKLSRELKSRTEMTAGEALTFIGKKSWETHGTTVRDLLDRHGFIRLEKRGPAHVMIHVKSFDSDRDGNAVRDAEFGPLDTDDRVDPDAEVF